MANQPVVAVLMGSKSDLPVVEGAFKVFDEFGIPYEAHAMSAHRTPVEAMGFAANAEKNGFKVVICAAGMAAHLGGVVAAHTTLPVIGIPIASEPFNGLDALFSIVQMPPGIPVAAVTAAVPLSCAKAQECGALRRVDSRAWRRRAGGKAQGVPPQTDCAGPEGRCRASGRVEPPLRNIRRPGR